MGLFLLLLISLIALFVVQPIFSNNGEREALEFEAALESALGERKTEDAKANLLELEEAYKLGQIDEDIFRSLKEELQASLAVKG